MDLRAKLLDAAQPVLLYGTTPPRLGTAAAEVEAAAEKLAARIAGLPLDGLVVYDIQDETGRSAVPRPFPFSSTVDPRQYAAQLEERIGRPAIAYKALGAMDEAEWRACLDAVASIRGQPCMFVASGSLPPGAPADIPGLEYAGTVATPQGALPGDLPQVAFSGRSNVGSCGRAG